MEEQTVNSNLAAETTSVAKTATNLQSTGPSTERAAEHRQSYGTAKTEDLRDSGLWRTLTPVVVGLFCAALFIIPLLILVPLLTNSIAALAANSSRPEAQLVWLWVTMIVLVVGICVLVSRGLIRIFMTQAGNYAR